MEYHFRSKRKASAGGRALIPKNAFGWPILAGFARVGFFSYPFSDFYFLVGRF